MKTSSLLLAVVTGIFWLPIQAQCWKAVSCGDQYVGAIQQDGSLFMWGTNTSGQLGNGNTMNLFSSSSQVAGNNWQWLSASKCLDNNLQQGSSHTLAIQTDGSLWAWGNNNYGQLGNGSFLNSSVPVQIGTDTTWVKVLAGALHSLALKSDGTLWAWGNNAFGQLGIGTLINANTPVQVGTANNWTDFSTYESHNLATRSDGTLWAWGKNNFYQLGLGNNQNRTSPVQVGSGNQWHSPSVGYQYSFALQQDSSLWGWGNNNAGQLGNGNIGTFNPNPIQIGASSKWTQISSGREHSIALQANGTLWGWGMNFFGQLGQGNNSFQITSPVQITNDSNYTFINNGHYYSMAMRADTVLLGWGQNFSNVLFTNDNSDRNLPTPVGCAASTNYYQTLNIAVCGSYTSPSGNYTWTSSGTYFDTIPIAAGGDSLFTVLLTIYSSNTGIDLQSACDSFTWIDGVTYSTSTNTPTWTLPNQYGCDSTVSLHLTLGESNAGVDSITACNSFTWIDGITYISSNNSATVLLTNAAGCDSLVSLHLSLTSLLNTVSQMGVTLTADQSGATYQWVNCAGFTPINGATGQSFTPTVNGDYAVIVLQANCIDTSACFTVSNVGIQENALQQKISLYPNPSQGTISIDLRAVSGWVTVRITDALGREVYKETHLGGAELPLNLEANKGVYWVTVTTEDERAVLRLMSK